VHPCSALHGAFIFWIYTPLRRRGRGTARVDDDDHTTHYYYHYPFHCVHSFSQNASDFPHLSLTPLTHSLASFPLFPFLLLRFSPSPPLNRHFSVLLLFQFWLYDPSDLSLWFSNSFHLHPFTLSLSYDYFLLPRICILPPLTTLTTRASPSSSFKSTHSLPLLSLSLSHPSVHQHIHPGPFRFRRIRDTTNNHAQVRYASTSHCTRSTGSTLYTCSALPCSMSLRRVNLIFIQRSLAAPPLMKEEVILNRALVLFNRMWCRDTYKRRSSASNSSTLTQPSTLLIA